MYLLTYQLACRNGTKKSLPGYVSLIKVINIKYTNFNINIPRLYKKMQEKQKQVSNLRKLKQRQELTCSKI